MCKHDVHASNVGLVDVKFSQVDQPMFCHPNLFVVRKMTIIYVTDTLIAKLENGPKLMPKVRNRLAF